jgi:ribonuclease Z
VSERELVVLGTASQAPTRSRNHNGYLLLFAGVTASQITRICITHFHRDHCLGLPGVLQRMSLDRVPHVVDACHPAQNQDVFTRLRHAALFHDVVNLKERPVAVGGTALQAANARVEAQPLSHSVPATGWRRRTGGGCCRTSSPPLALPARTSGGCSARAAWSPVSAG